MIEWVKLSSQYKAIHFNSEKKRVRTGKKTKHVRYGPTLISDIFDINLPMNTNAKVTAPEKAKKYQISSSLCRAGAGVLETRRLRVENEKKFEIGQGWTWTNTKCFRRESARRLREQLQHISAEGRWGKSRKPHRKWGTKTGRPTKIKEEQKRNEGKILPWQRQ